MSSFSNFSLPVYPASPEAVPPTPRQIEITFWARVKRAAVLVGLLLGPNIALVFGYLTGAELRALDDSGVHTTGTVEYLTKHSSRRSGYTYRASYLFTLEGVKYIKQTTVTRQEFDSMTEGGPASVTYLPANPHVNCLGTPGPRLSKLNGTVVMIAGLVALGFGVVMVILEFNVRREIRLATHGLPTVGRITENGMQRNRNRTSYWSRYEFSSPTERHATSWHWVPWIIWERIPRGQPVTILYDPENPSNHLPLYAFKYIRVRAVEVASAPPLESEIGHSFEAAAIVRRPNDGVPSDGIAARGGSWGYSETR